LVCLEDAEDASAAAAAPKPKGFGATPGGAAAPERAESGGDGAVESRWRAPPVDASLWRVWAAEHRAAADPPLPVGAPFFAAVALDGTLSRAGAGGPKWCGAHA
jgi:hypothetical protein